MKTGHKIMTQKFTKNISYMIDAGQFNRMCALWRHLVSACEVKAHLIG